MSNVRKSEIIKENVEYLKKLDFKTSTKEKDLPLMY